MEQNLRQDFSLQKKDEEDKVDLSRRSSFLQANSRENKKETIRQSSQLVIVAECSMIRGG